MRLFSENENVSPQTMHYTLMKKYFRINQTTPNDSLKAVVTFPMKKYLGEMLAAALLVCESP